MLLFQAAARPLLTFLPQCSAARPLLTFLPGGSAVGWRPIRGGDALSDGLLELLRPGVQEVDGQVQAVRESQVELREQIDRLAAELCRVNDEQKVSLDLDPYVKKLLNARRRVVLVSNILQNAQERLRRLNHSVAKEMTRRKAYLESRIYMPGSPSK
ncbi:SNARE-associated protein Snapin [Rhinoraja longicauda]